MTTPTPTDRTPGTDGEILIDQYGDRIQVRRGDTALYLTAEEAFNVGMNLATFAMETNGGPFPHREPQP